MSKGECDLGEYCDGVNPFCPTDVYSADGSQCSVNTVKISQLSMAMLGCFKHCYVSQMFSMSYLLTILTYSASFDSPFIIDIFGHSDEFLSFDFPYPYACNLCSECGIK